MLGETLVPPYVQRLLMARDVKQIKRGTMASGLLSVPFFLLAGGIGLVAFAINPNLSGNQALPYVADTVLPPVVRGFVVAAIIAVLMSSAAGFLNAAAIAFVNDIVKPLKPQYDAEKFMLRLAKLSTAIVGIGSLVFALMIKNVLDILLYAYQFWSPIIIVPLAAAIFGVKVRPRDFLLSGCGGLIAMTLSSIYCRDCGLSPIVVGVLGNLLVFSVLSVFSARNLSMRNT